MKIQQLIIQILIIIVLITVKQLAKVQKIINALYALKIIHLNHI